MRREVSGRPSPQGRALPALGKLGSAKYASGEEVIAVPMRKKTLRRMSPEARRLARLIGDLESVTRRLKNYLPVVQKLELWAKAAQAQRKAEDRTPKTE